MRVKKLILVALPVLCLIGCGHRDEMLKAIEKEYAILDYDTLRVEHDIVKKMVDEQQRVANSMQWINFATGVVSALLVGHGSSGDSENKQLQYDKLRLEALSNLLNYKKQMTVTNSSMKPA